MNQASAKDEFLALEQKHRALSEQVQRLERRAYLTPGEQREMSVLKKRKLAAKDRLYRLQQSR